MEITDITPLEYVARLGEEDREEEEEQRQSHYGNADDRPRPIRAERHGNYLFLLPSGARLTCFDMRICLPIFWFEPELEPEDVASGDRDGQLSIVDFSVDLDESDEMVALIGVYAANQTRNRGAHDLVHFDLYHSETQLF